MASAHFSPDGHHVVTANWDNTARIWNMQTGKVEYKLVGHSASVNEAVFSPEGAKVLTASDDMTAAIWDARTGNCLVRLKEHLLAVRSAAFSQDGRRSGHGVQGQDGPHLGRRQRRAAPRARQQSRFVPPLSHDQAVLCAAFSPDDACIITGCEDNRAKR